LPGQRTGDLRLPAAGKDRQHVRWADFLRGLGRNGPWQVALEVIMLEAVGLAERVPSGAVGVGARRPVAGDVGGYG